jgi:hypothetical protein
LDGILSRPFHGETVLNDLPDGEHVLEIGFRSSELGTVYPAIAYFKVEANSPIVSILSPIAKTYNDSSVPLTFTINEPLSNVCYELNSQSYSTSGNSTLINLPAGQHNLTVYVADLAGKVTVSETVYFAVNTSAIPIVEPFPTLLVIAVTLTVVAVVAVGLLVYFKKRKRLKST